MKAQILRAVIKLFVSMILLSIVSYTLFVNTAELVNNEINSGTTSAELIYPDYWSYILGLVQLNWGNSINAHYPVSGEFLARLPATLELVISAFLISILCGLALATISSRKPQSAIDKLASIFTQIGQSLPVYWWGLALVLIFSLRLDWAPVSSRISHFIEVDEITGFLLIDTLFLDSHLRWVAFFDALHHMLLPVITLSFFLVAYYTSIVRGELILLRDSTFIKLAKAKGLTDNYIFMKHLLPNLYPILIRSIQVKFPQVISASLLVEYVFDWPGISSWLLNAIFTNDTAVVHGAVLGVSLLVLVVNFVIVVLNGVLVQYKGTDSHV
jgi:dipeptide transport system permease protein